jgi:hypothetical protein
MPNPLDGEFVNNVEEAQREAELALRAYGEQDWRTAINALGRAEMYLNRAKGIGADRKREEMRNLR